MSKILVRLINSLAPLALAGLTLIPGLAAAEITISVRRDMSFGLIPSNTGTCKMDFKGNKSGTTGCFGRGTIARFRAEGEPRRFFNIRVPGPINVAPGVNFQAFTEKSRRRINRRGLKNFDVRGKLTLNNAQPGDLDFTYVVVVDYE